MPIPDEMIFEVCKYLNAKQLCKRCPKVSDTIYGPATMYCRKTAEENIHVVIKVLDNFGIIEPASLLLKGNDNDSQSKIK